MRKEKLVNPGSNRCVGISGSFPKGTCTKKYIFVTQNTVHFVGNLYSLATFLLDPCYMKNSRTLIP